MSYFQVFILSIVEGLTEFLPISSTGHLILTQKLLNITTSDFSKSFDIIIQLSAILAIVCLYWKKIISQKYLWKNTLIAFIPTGIIGLVLYNTVKNIFMDNVIITIISLFIGGIIFIVIDSQTRLHNGVSMSKDLSPKKLLNIGLFQSISMIPGVSRSASSIIGGMFVGLSKKEAVEFSFLLAIPTMLVATGYDLLKTGFSFSSHEIYLLLFGSVISFLSAIIAVKGFTEYLGKHRFSVFGYYRILLALLVYLFLQ